MLPTTTPEDGEIAAAVIVGAVFSTVTLADELTDNPSESVAVAVHVMLEPTSVSEAVTVYVLPVPTDDDPTDHAYVGVIVPSSGSDPVAKTGQ